MKFVSTLVLSFMLFIVACSPSTIAQPESPLFASSIPPDTPEYHDWIQNEGELCIVPTFITNEASYEFIAISEIAFEISPGCFSSSCTTILNEFGSVQFNPEDLSFLIQSVFYLQRPAAVDIACTDDCGGGGVLRAQKFRLDEGRYTIRWGDEQVGEFVVPSSGRPDNFCFKR